MTVQGTPTSQTPVSTPNQTTPIDVEDKSTPRRGGHHSSLGLFMGGSPLNLKYDQVDPANAYSFTTQLRHERHLPNIENALQKKKQNMSIIKFDGKLDVKEGTKELSKNEFILAVKETVDMYGFETFFYVPHPHKNKMINISKYPHVLFGKAQSIVFIVGCNGLFFVSRKH